MEHSAKSWDGSELGAGRQHWPAISATRHTSCGDFSSTIGQSPDPGSFWALGSLRRVGFGAANDGPEGERDAADAGAGGATDGEATGAGGAGASVAVSAGGAAARGGEGAAAGVIGVDGDACVRARRATPVAKTRLAETAAITITQAIRTGWACAAGATAGAMGGAGRGVVMPDGVGVCAIFGDAGIASGGAGARGAGGGSES